MGSFKVKEIPDNYYFTKPVFLDTGFFIASPEMPFTGELKRVLLDWEFTEVFSEGEPQEEYRSNENEGGGDAGINEEVSLNERQKLEKAEEFYHSFLDFAEFIYIHISLKVDFTFQETADRIKELCQIVKDDRRFLLRVLKNHEPSDYKNYLAVHGVKSAIISVIIGAYLKLPTHRLIELGTAALLHEAGMIKVPSNIYSSNRPLSPDERKVMLNHPIESYILLRDHDFPLPVSIAALEHHERENGEGYPRKLSGNKISLYAKIIAVACSYEALTANRPYREAKDGYNSMLDLLKNTGKQYDDTVIRALVYSLSIYPIGLYVLLSNGKKGQVVDVNPENPRFPVVQILGEISPSGTIKTLETSSSEISIVRPLRREELGFTEPVG
ncbi:MAG: HD-GYP domain-containing protein [Treponema sp.]|jgi:HD-GYP domain-containing protein (c-di-GMP phosphodiesterase class II)|nr:HD-GYP domain-containing protein [Treponema sp.]